MTVLIDTLTAAAQLPPTERAEAVRCLGPDAGPARVILDLYEPAPDFFATHADQVADLITAFRQAGDWWMDVAVRMAPMSPDERAAAISSLGPVAARALGGLLPRIDALRDAQLLHDLLESDRLSVGRVRSTPRQLPAGTVFDVVDDSGQVVLSGLTMT